MKDKDGKPTGTQLTLTNADLSDGGSYTCVSANTHGEITRSVQLTVTKASSKRMTVTDIGKECRAKRKSTQHHFFACFEWPMFKRRTSHVPNLMLMSKNNRFCLSVVKYLPLQQLN